MIKLCNIKKSYGRGPLKFLALDLAEVEVQTGESIAILGPSGSGKSTLLNILGCLDDFDEGSYLYGGSDLAQSTIKEKAALRNRKFGFVLQNFGLLEDYTAKENILLPTNYLPRKQRKKARETLMEIVDQIGLEEAQLNKYPNQLSRGQQQRVAIARALINDPEVILADEPTGNLDSKNAQLVIEMLIRENKKGKTVVIVTHDEIMAEAFSRKIRILDGHVV